MWLRLNAWYVLPPYVYIARNDVTNAADYRWINQNDCLTNRNRYEKNVRNDTIRIRDIQGGGETCIVVLFSKTTCPSREGNGFPGLYVPFEKKLSRKYWFIAGRCLSPDVTVKNNLFLRHFARPNEKPIKNIAYRTLPQAKPVRLIIRTYTV